MKKIQSKLWLSRRAGYVLQQLLGDLVYKEAALDFSVLKTFYT